MKLHIIWMAANNYVKQPCDLITLALDMRHPKNTQKTHYLKGLWTIQKHKQHLTGNGYIEIYLYIYIYVHT